MRFLGALLNLAIVGILVGAVAIVGVFWYYGRDLPGHEQLAEYRPAELSTVYDAKGQLVAEFAREKRVFVPIDDVPDMVKWAFISAEDKNFYHHIGVDIEGIAKATVNNVRSMASGRRGLSGASTITQQMVKNILLTNERSLRRKVREALLAVKIERELSKNRILELYLNEIFLGARSYGIASAARNYFDKELEDLTVEEAAYLAALPKKPSSLHPVRQREKATDRRNYVLREMFENGYLDEAGFSSARQTDLTTQLSEDEMVEGDYEWDAAYVVEDVRNALSEALGEKSVYGDGLVIETTFDPALQKLAAGALRHGMHRYSRRYEGYSAPAGRIDNLVNWPLALSELDLPRDLGNWKLAAVLDVSRKRALIGFEDETSGEIRLEGVQWARKPRKNVGEDENPLGPEPDAVSSVLKVGDVIYAELVDEEKGYYALRNIPLANGAVVALDPKTGQVLAMQGGISAQHSIFNRVTQARRQPGSAFKPIVYAAALENGFTPTSRVLDTPVTVLQPDGTYWKPKNYSETFRGEIPIRIALEKSYNLLSVRIAQKIGMDKIADMARELGVYENMPPYESYALGAGETTLLQMASAYAAFVNNGRRVKPYMIENVTDRFGNVLVQKGELLCIDCNEDVVDVPADAEPAEHISLLSTIDQLNADEEFAQTGTDLEPPADPDQIVSEETAYQIVSLMHGVTRRGTASRLSLLGFPVGGKTGTTNESRDAWFIGFAPDIVFGCYIGFDTPKSLGKKASGGALCGPVFHKFMEELKEGTELLEFEVPEGIELVKINRHTGKRALEESEGKDYIVEAFKPGTAPEDFEDPYALPSQQLNIFELDALPSDAPADHFGERAGQNIVSQPQSSQTDQAGTAQRPLDPSGQGAVNNVPPRAGEVDQALAQPGWRVDPATGFLVPLETQVVTPGQGGVTQKIQPVANPLARPEPQRRPQQAAQDPPAQPARPGPSNPQSATDSAAGLESGGLY